MERRASANTECRIDFEVGKAEVKPELGENARSIEKIRKTLASLLENDVFDLDSVVVSATASPEGSYSFNEKLAQKRSVAVSGYFEKYMKHYADSLVEAAGVSMNLDGTQMQLSRNVSTIRLTPRCIHENWEDLHALVVDDVVMNVDQKDHFFRHYKTSNPDSREAKLKTGDYYKYMRESLYPRLRTVKFNFYLHRKGMVKDTVHTTVIDSAYMRGVQALRDMDYDAALALLRPYEDYNTAVAYMGMERNRNAMRILSRMEKTAEVNYLMAILYSREGDHEKAVECYVRSCRQNHSYVYRGNLDPEISVLIKTYGLNQEDEYIDEY